MAALHDINPGLGTIGLDFLVTSSAAVVCQGAGGRFYFDRNLHLTGSGGPFASGSVEVRFYGLTSELARLQAADASATLATLKATQYSSPNEDCDLANNSATGESRVLPLAASMPGTAAAPHRYRCGRQPSPSSGAAAPWPGPGLNSTRVEVEHCADGTAFAAIAQVAAGNSTTASPYAYL